MSVHRFRRKPRDYDREDQVAARYTPGEPLDDLLTVARMASASAELAEVQFASGAVLVVRYPDAPGDHRAEWKFESVKPGDWLAYSQDSYMLYDATDANWRQWYDEVTER